MLVSVALSFDEVDLNKVFKLMKITVILLSTYFTVYYLIILENYFGRLGNENHILKFRGDPVTIAEIVYLYGFTILFIKNRFLLYSFILIWLFCLSLFGSKGIMLSVITMFTTLLLFKKIAG